MRLLLPLAAFVLPFGVWALASAISPAFAFHVVVTAALGGALALIVWALIETGA